jgi:glucose-1-phosphate cytidylyltransferase
MKAVILAGGLGSRLAEETSVRPKPMVEIGGRPILWHLMKILGEQGVSEFIICCGYKGYLIKEYFANFFLHAADFTVDLKNNRVEVLNDAAEPWRVTLVDTGEATQTGGRLLRIRHLLDEDEPFLLTYGDGLADVDLPALRRFHDESGRRATVTAVRPAGRFGALDIDGDRVSSFVEKPEGDGGWVNGGFFVVEPDCLDLIGSDSTIWEHGPLSDLAAREDLAAYRHDGFWQCMDTLRDRHLLEQLWNSGSAPWRIW